MKSTNLTDLKYDFEEKVTQHLIKVSDISIPELLVYSKLSEHQLKHFYEPEAGIFIAESPNVILRALNAGYLPESMLVETGHIYGEAREALEKAFEMTEGKDDFKIYTAETEVLMQITGYYMVRGLLAVMRRRETDSMEQICRTSKRVAVLEHIVNPTNVGAILRNAAGLGMDGVLLTADCADPLYRRAARVSMGTVFQIPWAFFPEEKSFFAGQTSDQAQHDDIDHHTINHSSSVQLLKSYGFQIAAMALEEDSIGIDSALLKKVDRLAIVLGSEGPGLDRETIQSSDYVVKIPMYHDVDSLNVAAASALAFWEISNRKAR